MALVVVVLSFVLDSVCEFKESTSVHVTIFHFTVVLISVLPGITAASLLLIIDVLSFIHLAICPDEHAFAMHLSIGELADVLVAIRPVEDTLAL